MQSALLVKRVTVTQCPTGTILKRLRGLDFLRCTSDNLKVGTKVTEDRFFLVDFDLLLIRYTICNLAANCTCTHFPSNFFFPTKNSESVRVQATVPGSPSHLAAAREGLSLFPPSVHWAAREGLSFPASSFALGSGHLSSLFCTTWQHKKSICTFLSLLICKHI